MKLSEIRFHLQEQQTRLDALLAAFNQPTLPSLVDAASPPNRQLICFVGLPGAGKSTQINFLTGHLNCPVYHLAKYQGELFLELNGRPHLSIDVALGSTSWSAEELDTFVFDQVQQQPSGTVILDGFPRSIPQAERLLAFVSDHSWTIRVIYLQSDIRHAWKHQINRARQRRLVPDIQEFNDKIERSLRKDLPAIGYLAQQRVPFISIDAKLDKDLILAQILKYL